MVPLEGEETMNGARQSAHRRWRAALIASVALAVAACGTTNPEPRSTPAAATSAPPSASASPSASPIGTASASASPSASSDVGTALVAKLSAFAFAARSTLAGELLTGSARYAIGGSFDVSGVDHHTIVNIKAPGRQTVESIYQAGLTFQRIGTGPWYQKPPTLHDADLSGFFRTIKTATDAGVETKNGQSLHHLTLPAGVSLPPTVFGVTDPSMSGISGTIEFWASDDGTPGIMAVHNTWTQTVSGSPVDGALTIEFTFTGVDTVFAIEPPSDVWTTYKSKISHMTFGYPVDWDLFKNLLIRKTRYDQVGGPADAYADFYRFAANGFTANQIVSYVKSNPDHEKGFHVDSIKSIKMAGIAGRQMRIHATFKGKKRYWIYTFVLKGAYFYEVDLFDAKGHEADDLKLANEFVATVIINK